jgi:Spy/CpxP family protein refolding chaperone
MKSSLKSLLAAAFVGLAVLPALSLAQPPAGGGGGRGRGPTPEQSVARIEEGGITLSAEVKTKVMAIYTKAASDMQAVPQEERREKGQAIRTAADKEVRALLTPEQQAKFDALPAPARGGRGPGGGGNAPKKE